MKDIVITKIATEARGGANINDCIEQLIIVALGFDCEAVLSHNNHEYTATSQKIIATVIEKLR
ncbi:hypothetical protein LCGC14_2108740 [marine sediment metagenome]|uniref:Uncharacterized protein n=1 Tax=marine sediment metagenome TaxID=412755 RepID=A0A0F9EUU7_9ZZZZ